MKMIADRYLDRVILTLCVVIVLFSIFLRVYSFGSVPISMNRDEVSIAYNAWTISQEGIDEWGERFPVMFKAFGDYKLPGYIYTLSAFLLVFEPTAAITRLPSLLAGISSIVLIFLLSRHVWSKATLSTHVLTVSLFSICYWAIFYSRMAYEANLALTLQLAGIYFLLYFTKSKHFHALLLAPFLFFLASLTYNASLILFPFIICFFIFWYWRVLIKNKVALAVFTILSITCIATTVRIQQYSFEKKNDTTVFFDPYHQTKYRESRIEAKTLLDRALSHQVVYFSKVVMTQYVESLSPQFVSLQGGTHPWHGISGFGHIQITTYTLSLVGLLFMLSQLKKNTALLFLASILVVTPIPAAITVDAPHATRSLLFFTLLAFFSSHAVFAIMRSKLKLLVPVILLVVLGESMVFGSAYFSQKTEDLGASWNIQLLEVVGTIKQSDSTTPVYVQITPWSEYIYVALGERISAGDLQKLRKLGPIDSVGYEQIESIGRYTFVRDLQEVPTGAILVAQDASAVFHITEPYLKYPR